MSSVLRTDLLDPDLIVNNQKVKIIVDEVMTHITEKSIPDRTKTPGKAKDIVEVMELIRNKIGGRWVKSINISSYSKRPYLYRLIIQKQEAMRYILKKLIPYLIVKKKQAEIILNFIDSRIKRNRKWKNNGVGSSSPYNNYENKMYEKVYKLSARGNESKKSENKKWLK